jgi:hypothetical protein
MYDWDKDGKIDAEDDAITLMVMDDDEIPGHKKKRAKGCSCGCASTLIVLAAFFGLVFAWLR